MLKTLSVMNFDLEFIFETLKMTWKKPWNFGMKKTGNHVLTH